MISSLNYLHLTEFGNLELCRSAELCQNILNGRLIFPEILREEPAYVEKLIKHLCSRHHISYLIISADPFCLRDNLAELFSALRIPKGMILCDTHHGHFPLSRTVRFCLRANIQSVLIRFNQRHSNIFKRHGIWCDATVLSPDLHEIAIQKLARTKSESSLKKESSQSNLNQEQEVADLNQAGCFVGNVSNVHSFRSYQLQLLKSSSISIETRTSPTPAEMIKLLGYFPWGLNLPLNGDFNRRYAEIILSNIPVLSEYIPQSQTKFPFSLLTRHITFFGYEDNLQSIRLLPSRFKANGRTSRRSSPIQSLLQIVRSSYDTRTLQSFHSSLLNQSNQPSVNDMYLPELMLYDECLSRNINPFSISKKEAKSLLEASNHLVHALGIYPNEEFYRLKCYAYGC